MNPTPGLIERLNVVETVLTQVGGGLSQMKKKCGIAHGEIVMSHKEHKWI